MPSRYVDEMTRDEMLAELRSWRNREGWTTSPTAMGATLTRGRCRTPSYGRS